MRTFTLRHLVRFVRDDAGFPVDMLELGAYWVPLDMPYEQLLTQAALYGGHAWITPACERYKHPLHRSMEGCYVIPYVSEGG